MKRISTIRDIISLLGNRRKVWIAPVIVFLLLIALVVVLAEGSVVAPFIYSIF